jgi:hypothetical protein
MSRRSFPGPNTDEARQALLDNRQERSHPKRHRTRRRSKALQAKALRRAAVAQAKRAKALLRHRYAARAYWRGESDEHP